MNNGFEIIDPGHVFRLLVLDKVEGKESNLLHAIQFVKREGDKFPGNKGAHEGTTLQAVIRALHSRVAYLHSQHPADYNLDVMENLKMAHYHLEERAAYRHGVAYELTPCQSLDAPMCQTCGHTYFHSHEECANNHSKTPDNRDRTFISDKPSVL